MHIIQLFFLLCSVFSLGLGSTVVYREQDLVFVHISAQTVANDLERSTIFEESVDHQRKYCLSKTITFDEPVEREKLKKNRCSGMFPVSSYTDQVKAIATAFVDNKADVYHLTEIKSELSIEYIRRKLNKRFTDRTYEIYMCPGTGTHNNAFITHLPVDKIVKAKGGDARSIVALMSVPGANEKIIVAGLHLSRMFKTGDKRRDEAVKKQEAEVDGVLDAIEQLENFELSRDSSHYVPKVIVGDLNTYDGDNGIPSSRLLLALNKEEIYRVSPAPVITSTSGKTGKKIVLPPTKDTDFAYLVPGALIKYGKILGTAKSGLLEPVPVDDAVTDHKRILKFTVSMTVCNAFKIKSSVHLVHKKTTSLSEMTVYFSIVVIVLIMSFYLAPYYSRILNLVPKIF